MYVYSLQNEKYKKQIDRLKISPNVFVRKKLFPEHWIDFDVDPRDYSVFMYHQSCLKKNNIKKRHKQKQHPQRTQKRPSPSAMLLLDCCSTHVCVNAKKQKATIENRFFYTRAPFPSWISADWSPRPSPIHYVGNKKKIPPQTEREEREKKEISLLLERTMNPLLPPHTVYWIHIGFKKTNKKREP